VTHNLRIIRAGPFLHAFLDVCTINDHAIRSDANHQAGLVPSREQNRHTRIRLVDVVACALIDPARDCKIYRLEVSKKLSHLDIQPNAIGRV
jgi:hypothetical protein